MKTLQTVMPAALLALAACSTHGLASAPIPPAPAAAAASATPAPASHLLYAVNNNSTISAFAVHEGRLTLLSGSPFDSHTNAPQAFGIALDPAAPVLFATGANAVNGGNVAVFRIEKDGALRFVSSRTAVNQASVPVVARGGTLLYVLSHAGIYGFRISAKGTVLRALPGSPYPVTCPGLFCSPYLVSAVARGSVLYVADNWGWVAETFRIAANGSLTQVAAVGAHTSPNAIALAPSGKNAYVTNGTSGDVSAYAVSGATLTPLPGSPFPAGHGATGIVVSPNGRYAYVANNFDSTVSGYAIVAGGALKPLKGSPFADAGGGPVAIAMDASGAHAYVTNGATNAIAVYRVAKTGALSPVAGSPFAVGNGAAGPKGIVLTP